MCPSCGRPLTASALGKQRPVYVDGRWRKTRTHLPCQARLAVEDIERLMARGIMRRTA